MTNPAVFFSESDVQALFFKNLFESEDLGLNQLYSTGCSIGLNLQQEASTTTYKTLLMHKEYGLNTFPNHRADLVILNKNDIRNIVDPINLKDATGYLTPDYIFEFGTEKSAGCLENLIQHSANDLKKLTAASKCGFLIHIQRNYLRGFESQANIDKHDSYAEILKGLDFTSQRIKILYFKIDFGGPKRTVFRQGKIKMFNGQALVGVNQKEIRQRVYDYLTNKP